MFVDQPTTLRLRDYKAPDFSTDKVFLNFDIHEDHTKVTSKVTYRRTEQGKGATQLVLNAENPNPGKKFILSVKHNGMPLAPDTGYVYDDKEHKLILTLDPGEDEAELEIETYLEPQNNSALEGIYKSESAIVSQCESEGFRRITPFLDRPDVLAKYTVRVESSKAMCPVLMANGNKVQGGQNGERHWATFEDPWPKPCYLFATANGKLECVADVFKTRSGRDVNIRVYTEAGQQPKGLHALNAVKQSMKWDEDVFDCEYDLDNFNVVAVSKFNFGAMENKGLNIFRDSLIMADPTIATDADYQRITDIIGHEYFHNYSGNRVTVKNWFYISLKEGLTVLREQMFTAFTTSDATERIEAVQFLRGSQFPQDDSPIVHPVLPQEVQSIENCYTATIYEKGAEVLRMMGELMGREKLIEGIKHYFKKHDGQAVTIHEFAKAMEDVSGLKFDEPAQFFQWYTQSGRPRVKAEGVYDPAAKTYTLTLEQKTPPTKDQPIKQPQYIPVRMGLVGADGTDMPLTLKSDMNQCFNPDEGKTERVLHFNKAKQTFVFTGVQSEPSFHSLMRGFSAPVDLDPGLTEDQLYKQALNDTDGFNRWDAGQKLAIMEQTRMYKSGGVSEPSPRYVEMMRTLVKDRKTDPALLALALTPPSIKELEAALGNPVAPATIAKVRRTYNEVLGRDLYGDLENLFDHVNDGKPYSFDYESVGRRSLKALAVNLMTHNGAARDLQRAKDLYFSADNMTDKISAMAALADHTTPARDAVFDAFLGDFGNDVLVIQKWFSMQAGSRSDSVIDFIKGLTGGSDPKFDWQNPGHVQNTFRRFGANYEQFHRRDGKGYDLVADAVIKANSINPKVASGLIEPLCDWRKYTDDTQKLMIARLERIASVTNLATDVKEKLLKSLPDAQEKKKLGFNGPSL